VRAGDESYIFAAGPDFRHGVASKPFENANLYPLLAWILGLDITNLKTGPVDGKPGVLDRSRTATRVIFLAAREMRSATVSTLKHLSRTGIPNPTETSRNT
jgi:hypothetical protein